MEKCVLWLRNCISECGIDIVFYLAKKEGPFSVEPSVYYPCKKNKSKHTRSVAIFKLISTIEELSDL